MLCALAAARPDLRRHALWMALAALPFFLAAPLICALAALGGREAALAVETSSALAGAAALCALFLPECARRADSGAHGAPLWALWGVRAAWLVVALWVSAWIAALLLEAIGCSFAPRAACAGFANAAFLGGAAALAAASGSAFLAAALCALWFALDVCGLLPPALTLFALARGLSGNKLFLCLAGLAFTALAVSIRLRADSSRQT